MPPDLKRVGLIANWQARREVHPKNNSLRWLRFEEQKSQVNKVIAESGTTLPPLKPDEEH
ncbi:hypothetical protein Glo7428_5244 (plasmid) [Gloeocapsa sp. PCC 7428]|uniref:hypothetical protein n=1 Tax=Gloeocapsa sp. PCC 7428 TaxID=1173026 RepID=UPI0002A5DAF5|nr:hypothetical protein [Gloeocapsa sp. PCC 7428]AFZ33620.1 hypothetical protein Glo7428_5244 [Gloeocapsa sp. PCC 7428]